MADNCGFFSGPGSFTNSATTASISSIADLEASVAELTLKCIGVVPKRILFHSRDDMEAIFRMAGFGFEMDAGAPPFYGIPLEYDPAIPPGSYKIDKRLA